jgi:uncharacterized protein YecT (DUF1311 family)
MMSLIRGRAAGTLIGLFWFVAWPAMASSPPPGPGFDRARDSGIESLIRGDPELSAADRKMTAFYQAALPGALGVGSSQRITQRNWLRERDKSCAGQAWREFHASLRACVAAELQERLEALAIATLMVTPDASLAEIGKTRPRAAALYKAAHDYASIDDPERRIRMVEADLASIYATMDANTREHLNLAPYYNAATAHDAASSDANFAAFFTVYATLGYQEVTVPPLGEVTALSDEAIAAQPLCQGTIRFSTGRDYIRLKDAVRLHRTEIWEGQTLAGGDDADDPSDQAMLAWRGPRKVRIVRAQAVLAAYYIRYFAIEATAAKRDAAGAIDALVRGPFHTCQ